MKDSICASLLPYAAKWGLPGGDHCLLQGRGGQCWGKERNNQPSAFLWNNFKLNCEKHSHLGGLSSGQGQPLWLALGTFCNERQISTLHIQTGESMKPKRSCHRKVKIKWEIKNDVLEYQKYSSPSKSLLCIVLLKETIILMFHKNLSGDFLSVVDINLLEESFYV